MAATYIEMSRDEDHGGGTWAFTNCVWAPTRKENGSTWPFWSKVSQIREGDIVLHLRGKNIKARFVGYSTASSDGFETPRRPPKPGIWSYADSFYRADLAGFTPFHQEISLVEIFAARKTELNQYFDLNRNRKANKEKIFFVRQSGRLQCLNGAYLSDANNELLIALFGESENPTESTSKQVVISVATRTQLSAIQARIGQARFSQEIKDLYGNQCCFPECNVHDSRFLIGSHIARWSDNEVLRGQMGNGLCLCLIHDKAFESGMFTLDQNYRVYVNLNDRIPDSEILTELKTHQYKQIRLAPILPLEDALLEHWIRVGLEP